MPTSVDLDGPLLLSRDRPHGLQHDGAVLRAAASGALGLSDFSAMADRVENVAN